jgi:PAS domain S-box-containing protein
VTSGPRGSSVAAAVDRTPFEEDAEQLFERAPCGYLTMRLDGTIERVNGTFLGWTGLAASEVVGRRFVEMLSAGGRIYHETHYAPLLVMQGAVREIAFDIVCADGKRLPVLVNASLDGDAAGEPRLIRAAVFGASHRREYERSLLRARDDERAARERTERLQRVSRALVATLDPAGIGAAVLEAVAAIATSGQALVVLVDADARSVEPAAWLGEQPTLGQSLLDEPGLAPLRDALTDVDGETAVAAPAAFAGVPAAAWGEGIAVQPCVAEGRVVAAICIGRSTAGPLDELERAFLAGLSEQCALALERARLFDHEHDVARTLQRNLLAGSFPQDPRVELAAFYRPGVRGLSVGGDWYDAFTPAPGHLMLVVGDIVGRGLEAASAMGRLRSAVRALAVAGFSPAELLTRLDAFAELDEPVRMTTLVCVDIELARGRACIASAGHLPALLLADGDEPQLVWAGRSLPLGALVISQPRAEFAFELRAGSRLILYTDGLVERRSRPIDSGFERLVAEAARSRDLPLAEMIGEVTRRLLGGEAADDDVCLMAVRVV